MSNCKCNEHTNAFLDLDGIPYLLAEYVDKSQFMQIDKSLIRSDIFVDQSDSMRAIIDVSINDIGMNNGAVTSVGNRTKQANLLKMITNNADLLDNQLDVIRGGLIVRVNYQLENTKTGTVIRSMCEDLRIPDRNYYISINSNDVDDNSVIVNFNKSLVSTINEFTHGNDRMILRITNIQLFYECVKRSVKMPRIKDTMTNGVDNDAYMRSVGIYDYHKAHQSQHMIGSPYCTSGNNYCDNDNTMMPRWSVFNRYYHFSEDASDIILHNEEIFDPMNNVTLIACGTARVNRSFIINPGHRLIFKLSIWKNDITVVSNTTNVAKALNVPVVGDNSSSSSDKCDCGCKDDNNDEIKDQMVLMLFNNLKSMIDQQNNTIGRLADSVKSLQKKVDNKHCCKDDKTDDKCDCTCDEDHKEMNDKISEIEGELDSVKDQIKDGCDCDDMEPMPSEVISDLLKDL